MILADLPLQAVELSTDEQVQEEVTHKVMTKYLGNEGERYVDAMV